MYKFIILSLVSLSVLPAQAGLKAKLIETTLKRETRVPVQAASVDEIVSLPLSKQIENIFSRMHLDPRVTNSGAVNRIVRDSFVDGSHIDATLRVDFFQKRRVTLLETKLDGIDVDSSVLKDFVRDAKSIKRTRDGSVYVKHVIPDAGITDNLSLRFSKYYESLLKKDYHDSKKVLIERYRQSQEYKPARSQGLH